MCPRSSPTPSRWFWSSWRKWRRIFRRYANWTSIRCWRTKPVCLRSMRASPSGCWSGSSKGPRPRQFRRDPGLSEAMATTHIAVKDGWQVFVRPIRPEDEQLIREFLRHVTRHDLRLRFFAPMKELTHEFIARLTQLDYARAMAFIAVDETTGEMLGVVRIHSDSDLRAPNTPCCCDPTSRAGGSAGR